MLHIVGPDVEYVAGPVPDAVDQVVVATEGTTKRVQAQDNIFAVEIPAGTFKEVAWKMADGRTVRPASR